MPSLTRGSVSRSDERVPIGSPSFLSPAVFYHAVSLILPLIAPLIPPLIPPLIHSRLANWTMGFHPLGPQLLHPHVEALPAYQMLALRELESVLSIGRG